MRILITGGAGFIGYHLASQLSEDPTNYVVLLDNFVRGEFDDEFEDLVSKSNVDFLSGDLTEPQTYEKVGAEYDEVYHLAAIIGVRNVISQPHEVLRVNLLSTLLILDWLTKGGGRKILFSSTSEVYAWTQQFYELPIPTREDVPLSLTDLQNPRSTYAASKILGELAVTQFCTTHDKPFVIVRFHNVYGPRMGYEHVIPELYQRAVNGENPLVVCSANHSRAFCFVTDAVAATIRSMREASAEGQTINVGNDLEEVTIGVLAHLLLARTKIAAGIELRDEPRDPIVRRCPDISRARKLLGYQPEVTLDQGLTRTLAWYDQRARQVP